MPHDWDKILANSSFDPPKFFDIWQKARQESHPTYYWKTIIEDPHQSLLVKQVPTTILSTWREAQRWTISGWSCLGNVCQYGTDGGITNLLIRVHVPMDGPHAGDTAHWQRMPIPESFQAIGVGTAIGAQLTTHRLSCDWKLNSDDPRTSQWRLTLAVETLSGVTWSGAHYDLLIEACRLACWEIIKRYQGVLLHGTPQIELARGRKIARL